MPRLYLRDMWARGAVHTIAAACVAIEMTNPDDPMTIPISSRRALLVGGASVEKASIGNVFLGVLLFHTMFIVAPAAGTKITGDSMIGEYFRVFVSYAVITVALVMYEAKKRKENRTLGQQLAIEQKAEEEGRTA